MEAPLDNRSTPRRPEDPAARMLRLVGSGGLVAIAAFYLLTEHLQHTLGALPWVVLLLCPLMHVFMHRGHGHGGHGSGAGHEIPHHEHPGPDGPELPNSRRK